MLSIIKFPFFTTLNKLLSKYSLFIRYVIAGTTAAAFDIFLLFLLADIFGIWYLTASVLAFVAAFFLGFSLQKFWTFKCRDLSVMHEQMFFYFISGILGLCINSAGMYIGVDIAHLHYLLTQILVGMFLAGFSFVFSYYITFRKSRKHL